MTLELILGGILAAIAAVGAAWFGGQRKGRKAAESRQEAENFKEYADVRKKADEAARRADGDTRPVDDRLREHGALRD